MKLPVLLNTAHRILRGRNLRISDAGLAALARLLRHHAPEVIDDAIPDALRALKAIVGGRDTGLDSAALAPLLEAVLPSPPTLTEAEIRAIVRDEIEKTRPAPKPAPNQKKEPKPAPVTTVRDTEQS